jgi:REP element-mobilizing transposase RayT
MPQSLHVLSVHIVFSTKHRRPDLSPELRPVLWAYMTGILKNLECCSITVGGYVEHTHILCNLSKKHAPMKILEIVKKESSKWIKAQELGVQSFHWQDGYGLFSVSPSHLESVRQYILKQEQHHRKVSFQQELLGILRKYRVSYDERYLWD